MNDLARELRHFPGVYIDTFGFAFRLNTEGVRESLPDAEMEEVLRSFHDREWKPGKERNAMACANEDCGCNGKDAQSEDKTEESGIVDQVNAYYVKIGSGAAEGMPQALADKLTIDYQQYLFRLTGF